MNNISTKAADFIYFNLLKTFVEFKLSFFKNGKSGQTALEAQRVAEICHHLEFNEIAHLSDQLSSMNRSETENFLSELNVNYRNWLFDFQNLKANEKIEFHKVIFSKVKELFQIEATQNSQVLQVSLYRCFDSLDSTLGIDYSSESQMPSDAFNKERIFAGSAESVQSSYSTIFSALREMNPKAGSHLIDLGCGFGRLGFVIGLHRPDMQFTGYEYVDHRIQNAKGCAKQLNLEQNVHFHTQDLSDSNFKLPVADIYYMYDPFSADTYKFILNQMLPISKDHPIMIATKGNAKDWLHEIAAQNKWRPAQSFDYGNLNLFCSY